jgi:hypothetical protein
MTYLRIKQGRYKGAAAHGRIRAALLQSCQYFLQSNANNNVVFATTTKYQNDVSQLIN